MPEYTRLYHGTKRGFSKGGLVLPVDWHKGEARPGHTEGGTAYAYATESPVLAAWYAFQAAGRGKAKVLTVEPFGEVEHDPSTYDLERDYAQVRSKDGFRVVAVYVLADDADPEDVLADFERTSSKKAW